MVLGPGGGGGARWGMAEWTTVLKEGPLDLWTTLLTDAVNFHPAIIIVYYQIGKDALMIVALTKVGFTPRAPGLSMTSHPALPPLPGSATGAWTLTPLLAH